MTGRKAPTAAAERVTTPASEMSAPASTWSARAPLRGTRGSHGRFKSAIRAPSGESSNEQDRRQAIRDGKCKLRKQRKHGIRTEHGRPKQKSRAATRVAENLQH